MTTKFIASTIAALSLFASAAAFSSPIGNYDGPLELKAPTQQSVLATRAEVKADLNDTMGNYSGPITWGVQTQDSQTRVAVKASTNEAMGNYGD